MFLSHVTIQNFRAIPRMALAMDDTTVLIGENTFGRTSVIRALVHILGGPAGPPPGVVHSDDFHTPFSGERPVPGPLRIVGTFVERSNGDWDRESCVPLRAAFVPAQGRLRMMRLECRAEPSGARETAVQYMFLGADNSALGAQPGRQALERLWSLIPLLRLKSDRRARAHAAAGTPAGPARDLGALYEKLTTARDSLTMDELARGVAAAAELGAPRARSLERAGARLGRWVDDFLRAPDLPEPGRGTAAHGHPSTGAQTLAFVYTLGAVLAARQGGHLHADATPFVAIEDAEANLHPIMLAAMWELISQLPAQRLVTTNSGEFLAMAPLSSLRRLVRRVENVVTTSISARTLEAESARRIAYHVRARRGGAFFARAWLLIEGETEFWLLPEFGRLLGYDFAVEGIACVEFAQSGLEPIINVADDLGIHWHLFTDGDSAGRGYADVAHRLRGSRDQRAHLTVLDERDIEHCLWQHGYAHVYESAAHPGAARSDGRRADAPGRGRRRVPTPIISTAIKKWSKPSLAISILDAASSASSPGVPPMIREMIESLVARARAASV